MIPNALPQRKSGLYCWLSFVLICLCVLEFLEGGKKNPDKLRTPELPKVRWGEFHDDGWLGSGDSLSSNALCSTAKRVDY